MSVFWQVIHGLLWVARKLEEAASHHPDHPLLGALGSVRHVLATRG